MSGLILLSLSSLIICVSTQYYQYPYNYGYPNTNYGRQSPCQSSCGNVQPRSYCQHLPCSSQYQPQYQQYQQYQTQYRQYQQQPYQQYPYNFPYSYYNNNNRKGYNPYDFFPSNSRSSWPSSSSSSSDPYANVPVEIIDDDSVPRRGVKTSLVGSTPDEYKNVPVEIIDDDSVTGSENFWRNVPKLPKVITSSSSNYSASQGAITSNTVTQNKPVRAVITRSFEPLKANPIINIDFVNGEVNKKEAEEEVETTTEAITTTESEDVAAVGSWFSK